MEKIKLKDLQELCKPELKALISKVQAIAVERGAYILEEWLLDLLEDVISKIHEHGFIEGKMRKFRMWLKRKLKW